MRKRRKVGMAFGVGGLVLVVAVALRLLPLLTGPDLPAGSFRLEIATERPNMNRGCVLALLAPVLLEELSGACTLGSIHNWPADPGGVAERVRRLASRRSRSNKSRSVGQRRRS